MSEFATSEPAVLRWHAPAETPFHVAGLAWFAQEGRFRRFPVHPPFPLPEAVDYLAGNPAGGQVRFRSDTRMLAVRVRLSAPAGMVHMPATGQCGIDCYVGEPGAQRFLAVTKYDPALCEYECQLMEAPGAEMRQITLNLPLYQGVEELQIGLDADATVLAPASYADPRPVIVYGTSNTQGGCASRPGMLWTNNLGRRLNREFINLGFSGSGKGEPDVARNIALISKPGGFILDYEGNAGSVLLRETLSEFIGILRAAHPHVPILVLSVTPFTRERARPELLEMRRRDRQFQQETVQDLARQGDPHLYFQNGYELLGDDDEGTVDGVHPTDLGFLRQADALEPVVRQIFQP